MYGVVLVHPYDRVVHPDYHDDRIREKVPGTI